MTGWMVLLIQWCNRNYSRLKRRACMSWTISEMIILPFHRYEQESCSHAGRGGKREGERMLRSTREHNLMFMEHTTTTCMYGRRCSHESGT